MASQRLITASERRDIFEWDLGNWSQSLPIWNKALNEVSAPGNALEIGARSGGLSLYLALRGHRVICSDVGNPERLAKPVHSRYSISTQISYDSVDGTSIHFPDESFDIVAFKSVLGAIGRNGSKEQQERAISEIYRVLRPGGLMLFSENLRGSGIHTFLRRIFTHWGGYWRYPALEEVPQFLSRFSHFEFATFGFFATFGRNEGQRNFLHRLDLLLNPIIPSWWRYIVFGFARK